MQTESYLVTHKVSACNPLVQIKQEPPLGGGKSMIELTEKTPLTLDNICKSKGINPESFAKKTNIPINNISEHCNWAYHSIYSIPYKQSNPEFEIARYYHGIQHVSRVALYIPILINLYRKHNDPDALSITEEDLYLLQIAALFHDSARENEGTDLWDNESAILLYCYLVNVLVVDHLKAKILAEAIANKDSEDRYLKLVVEGVKFSWHSARQKSKNIYQKILHDSDCLDIIRARICFDATYLYFYQNFAKNNPIAFKDMVRLIIEIRSFIACHGDSRIGSKPNIKKKLEGIDIYLKNINMIFDKKPTFPLMKKLFNGLLLSPKKLSRLSIRKKPVYDPNKELTDENIQAALCEGGVIAARGVAIPSCDFRGHTNGEPRNLQNA